MKSKRYLIWSDYDFMQPASNDRIIINNQILSNAGNLSFHTSVVRALMTEGTVFKSVFFKNKYKITDAFIAEANETYDAFILPMANACRSNYIPTLRALTKLVRGLKIPCIITSIGSQFGSREEIMTAAPYDDDVYALLSAVLDKSHVIGLRGEDTLTYLTRLGFTPEKDVRVIGCPSMFYYGNYLPETREVDLNPSSFCMVNTRLKILQLYTLSSIAVVKRFQIIYMLLSVLRKSVSCIMV